MKTVFLKLKYFLVPLILLAQVSPFADENTKQDQNTNTTNGKHPIPQIVQKNKQIVQGYNTEIQNLLIAIPKINNNEERDIAALRLAQLMEPVTHKKLQQALENLEKVVVNEHYPINVRISALEALSEHTLPNYNMDYIMVDIIDYPKLKIALRKAREKLKKNHVQTGKRFSKLHYFNSPHVMEAWSVMWITMYKDNFDIEAKFNQLLSSQKINIKKIVVLIAEKLIADYEFRFRLRTTGKINWLTSEIVKEMNQTNLSQQPQNNQETKENNLPTIGPCARRTFRSL